jgi:hypothetical protein
MSKGNDHGPYCKPCVYGEFGLTLLEASGDVADGVIEFEGIWRAGETFVLFDQQAVALLTAQGQSAGLLRFCGCLVAYMQERQRAKKRTRQPLNLRHLRFHNARLYGEACSRQHAH